MDGTNGNCCFDIVLIELWFHDDIKRKQTLLYKKSKSKEKSKLIKAHHQVDDEKDVDDFICDQ